MRYQIGAYANTTKTKSLQFILIALAFLATCIWGLASGKVEAVVGGPTCNVPSNYSTIQAAVDDMGCTTINVAAGTYVENVNITRSLTLRGAKAGVDVSGRTAAGAQESTISGTGADTASVTINAGNVVVNGFSITNANHGLGVIVKTAGDDAVIKNNIVDNVGNTTYPGPTVGVYLEFGPDDVRVTDNRISNVKAGTGSAQGILVGDSTSTNPSLGVVVDNNTITDATSTSKGAYGIQFNNGAKSTGYVTGKITNNTLKNLNGKWAHAVGLEGDTPNVVVRKNTISNLTSVGIDKVAVWFEDNDFFFTVDVNRNSLDVGTSAAGIAVASSLVTKYPTLTVDGTCNWWGSKGGPGLVASGTGSLVSPGVDFKPWLKSSKLKGDCGDKGDFNDHSFGHKNDDKDRWDWKD